MFLMKKKVFLNRCIICLWWIALPPRDMCKARPFCDLRGWTDEYFFSRCLIQLNKPVFSLLLIDINISVHITLVQTRHIILRWIIFLWITQHKKNYLLYSTLHANPFMAGHIPLYEQNTELVKYIAMHVIPRKHFFQIF